MKRFVPPCHFEVTDSMLKQLRSVLGTPRNALALTGAGISTESGIRDYRSPGTGLYSISNYRPITHHEFLQKPDMRRRYWARNFVGWPAFSNREPNRSHFALTALHDRLVTQNVDGLHLKAGSKNVVELHGTAYRNFSFKPDMLLEYTNNCAVMLSARQAKCTTKAYTLAGPLAVPRVVCLNCSVSFDRNYIQDLLVNYNPDWGNPSVLEGPDGDSIVPEELIADFQIPPCPSCGYGPLKPDIVFFGDSVPRERVDLVYHLLRESSALLVVGSSLQVFSSYRFALEAQRLEKPIAIVNIGPTRADALATLKLEAPCGELLSKLAEQSWS